MWEQDSSDVLAGDDFMSLVSHELDIRLASIARGANFPAADELPDAAAVRAGQRKLSFSDVDLATVTARVSAHYRATSGRAIDVYGPALFPPIHGDSRKLTQVIETLVSNAVKDSPAVRVALEIGEAVVYISVTSQGPMIPPDQLALVFNRFSPLRIEGLYISRQIVKMHGGTILVRSDEREGTTFTVVLPRMSEQVM